MSDLEIQKQARVLGPPCDYFGYDCPCCNQTCQHGLSQHESCLKCARLTTISGSEHICSFQSVPDITRKTKYDDLKQQVLTVGGFSCFEASANQYSRALFTRLCRDPDIKTDHSCGYPWTIVRSAR